MQGCVTVPFSSLFADTVSEHGAEWAHRYYCVKRGMPYWEFRFWLSATGNTDALAYYA